MKKIEKQTLLKFTVSHPDPEVEKQGAEALKDLIKAIGELTGKKVIIIEKKGNPN
jgi:hypothetical protein